MTVRHIVQKVHINIIRTQPRQFLIKVIFKLCAEQGFKPGPILHGSEFNLVHELCGTNQMVAFYAGPVDRFPDLAFINIEDMDLYFEFNFIVNRYAYISEAAKQFIDYTKEQIDNWEPHPADT
jgi:hypothetical protein